MIPLARKGLVSMCLYVCLCAVAFIYMFVLIESQFLGLSQKEVKTISDMDQHPVQRSTAVLGEREGERERDMNTT